MKQLVAALCLLLVISLYSCKEKNTLGSAEWSEYLGGPERDHFSPLTQIDSTNATQLKVAWIYHTKDSGQMQCNPIIVHGILYGMTASTQPFALDAATGKELWKRKAGEAVQYNTSRGVTYWEKGEDKRVLFTNGPWLYALHAATGAPVLSFGDSGKVSLKTGLGNNVAEKFVVSNSPGTVYENLIIMPLRVAEDANAAIGHIEAFDIETGKLQWIFHTIPQPGEFGYANWVDKQAYLNTNIGGANNWAGMAIDRARGIVFIPTGSAAFDYYGGNRLGDNLFANCLLALDAKTGKRKWHFQFVHHDILDRDPPAAPNLVTITRDGKKIDAVVQVTKQGLVFVFNRETGEPVFPVEERKIPASDVPGEQAWPTQPFPIKPAPYARQTLTENDISPYASNKDSLLNIFRAHRHEGPFTPLSQTGSVVFPGLDGGAEWGGVAADPEGILYVNSNEMAWLLAIEPTAQTNDNEQATGEAIYMNNCTACHGPERKGNPAGGFPSLLNIGAGRDHAYISNILSNGKGRMPAFPALSAADKDKLINYLLGKENKTSAATTTAKSKEPGLQEAKKTPYAPYRISAFGKFLDSKGLPAISPPWGTLNAINLNTGEYVWKIPFGEYPELAGKNIPPTGAESYGGPVITASGLLFIAGTKDKKFRVYNKQNGKLLWETTLPAAGFATPSTYEAGGKQYVVIACGGGKLDAPTGDSFVAFVLP